MNGIKYIREKSNLTTNELAERIGVTRKSVTLWENGIRKPNTMHRKQLSDFYGISIEWFDEIPEEKLPLLNEMRMYYHFEVGKEYHTFIPAVDGWNELSCTCGELEAMCDEIYANTLKRSKEFISRVERYLKTESVYVRDKITTAERGMYEIGRFLDLMDAIKKLPTEESYCKVPLRYEIMTVLFAVMVASGQRTTADIKRANEGCFDQDEELHVDIEYLNELIETMQKHWLQTKTKFKEILDNHIRDLKESKESSSGKDSD